MNGKTITLKESRNSSRETEVANGGSLNTPLASEIERRKLRGRKQSKCAAAAFAAFDLRRVR
jgi:hypothetical protein